MCNSAYFSLFFGFQFVIFSFNFPYHCPYHSISIFTDKKIYTCINFLIDIIDIILPNKSTWELWGLQKLPMNPISGQSNVTSDWFLWNISSLIFISFSLSAIPSWSSHIAHHRLPSAPWAPNAPTSILSKQLWRRAEKCTPLSSLWFLEALKFYQ